MQQLIQHHLQKVQTSSEKEFSTTHFNCSTVIPLTNEEETNPEKSDQYVTYLNYIYT